MFQKQNGGIYGNSFFFYLFFIFFFVYFKLLKNMKLAALQFQKLQIYSILVTICFKNSQTSKIFFSLSGALPKNVSESHNSNIHFFSRFPNFPVDFKIKRAIGFNMTTNTSLRTIYKLNNVYYFLG